MLDFGDFSIADNISPRSKTYKMFLCLLVCLCVEIGDEKDLFAEIVDFNDLSIAENVSPRSGSYPKFLCVYLCDYVFVCEDSWPKKYVHA